ncbi:MAG: hypothetical protein MHPSP_000406 [Paramarteilia canceri]
MISSRFTRLNRISARSCEIILNNYVRSLTAIMLLLYNAYDPMDCLPDPNTNTFTQSHQLFFQNSCFVNDTFYNFLIMVVIILNAHPALLKVLNFMVLNKNLRIFMDDIKNYQEVNQKSIAEDEETIQKMISGIETDPKSFVLFKIFRICSSVLFFVVVFACLLDTSFPYIGTVTNVIVQYGFNFLAVEGDYSLIYYCDTSAKSQSPNTGEPIDYLVHVRCFRTLMPFILVFLSLYEIIFALNFIFQLTDVLFSVCVTMMSNETSDSGLRLVKYIVESESNFSVNVQGEDKYSVSFLGRDKNRDAEKIYNEIDQADITDKIEKSCTSSLGYEDFSNSST